MSVQRHIFTTIVACMLLSLAAGCGEIELPTQKVPESEVPATTDEDIPENGQSTGNEDGKTNETTDDTTDDKSDDNRQEDDNDGDKDDLQIGRTKLTADGHIVIDDKLYLSAIEYRDIVGGSTTPETIAKNYEEGSLKGWRIPTLNDAKILTDVLTSETQWYGNSPMGLLNHALEESNLEVDQLYLFEGDGTKPIYYLCDAGTMAYTYAEQAQQQFTKVSTKNKYRLRLVKDL